MTFLASVFASKAWGIIRPFLPWIGLALAIFAAWLLAVGHGKSVQKAKDAAAWNAEHARAEGFEANQIALTTALNRQNAAVASLRAEADKRVTDGKAALAAAEKANRTLSDQAAALRKSAGRKLDAANCPVSDTLKQAGAV